MSSTSDSSGFSNAPRNDASSTRTQTPDGVADEHVAGGPVPQHAGDARTEHPTEHPAGHPSWDRWHEEMADWTGRSRIVLTPVAAPSILGLFGFAAATAMVSTWMAGWYGTAATPLTLWPFAFTAGGVAQLLAGMWCYRARDGLGTAMHGIWGSFWLGFGILTLLAQTGVHPPLALATDPAMAWWFIVLAVITAFGMLAALADNLMLFATLAALAVGSAFAAVGYYGGGSWAFTTAGWVLFGSACAATYVAGSMMLAGSFGRTILPTGKLSKDANLPGRRPMHPIEYPEGMPGSRVGQ